MSTNGRLVAVLDYGIGNLRSAQKALQRQGADARLTADPALVADAEGVVLPGVGAFGQCMRALESSGLAQPALDAIVAGKPFLGICVGMQMLYEGSEEAPDIPGLGILPGQVRLLPGEVKRPQMQWNALRVRRRSPLLAGLDEPIWMYFVHSYVPDDRANAIATCEYGTEIVAAVEKESLWATQFHPEKSGSAGLRLLSNFLDLVASSGAT
ncbi:MAG: Imidazole glycerol phosphate synthase subunit HisH [Acidimicrobiales bacterium]|nr:MAG: imidazole glycerol phosphate synthase subunit HisH [Actinomycetota bacterium]MBV6509562.1 Imidazole glycerol phosphate synthase subunit HisH [Acidimicrobiales bacterium]RIK06576.1 MAG: imidazole glycerol phosphate synthase subunit HisH [Acidobacteriota bacterium]